jgi:PhnB protein
MNVQPYLNFDGRCEEALEFYKKAIGAKIDMMLRIKENPDPTPFGKMPPGTDDKIMHSTFRVGDTHVMAADGYAQGKAKFEGFSLSIDAATEAEASRLFNALAEGGQVQMPLGKTFFSPSFGMVADKFGVSWMVIVPQQQG